MSEATTPPSGPVAPEPSITTSPKGETVIPMNPGGGLSRAALAKALKMPTLEDDIAKENEEIEAELSEEAEASQEEETSEGEESSDEVEQQEEKQDEKGEEEQEGLQEVDAAELGQVKTGDNPVRVKLADGRVVKIPRDATIIQKVDGELKEINLNEAISREVGELTVRQRLTAIETYKRSVQERLETAESKAKEYETFFDSVSEKAATNPEVVIAKIAEKKGILPGQVLRQLFVKGLKWAEDFKKSGGDLSKMEAEFIKIDREFINRQESARREREQQAQHLQKVETLAAEVKSEHNINDDEFTSATEELLKQEAFVGRSDEEVVALIAAKALQSRHENMVQEAVKSVPGAAKNQKLIAAIIDATNPRDWKVEEIKELVKKAVGSYGMSAKPLKGSSVTGKPLIQPSSAKPSGTKPQVVRGLSGLKAALLKK